MNFVFLFYIGKVIVLKVVDVCFFIDIREIIILVMFLGIEDGFRKKNF